MLAVMTGQVRVLDQTRSSLAAMRLNNIRKLIVGAAAIAIAGCATAAPAPGPQQQQPSAPAQVHQPLSPFSPYAIAAGKDGAIWYTEYQGDGIGRITTTGSVMRFKIDPSGFAERIAAGPDEAMWFTDTLGNRLGRVQSDNKVAYVKLPHDKSGPTGIVTGPDGDIWFNGHAANRIGR